ncbi:hypothetical protein ACFQX7_00015 [Luedemannella flava]
MGTGVRLLQQWADMVWVETTLNPDRVWATTLAARWPAATRFACASTRCRPRSAARKPAGTFESGSLLTAAQWTPIAGALRAAKKAPTCSTPAERFALLRRVDDTQGEIYVELTGCRRIMIMPIDGRPFLGLADTALVALLDSAT